MHETRPVCSELLIFDTNQQFATHTPSQLNDPGISALSSSRTVSYCIDSLALMRPDFFEHAHVFADRRTADRKPPNRSAAYSKSRG